MKSITRIEITWNSLFKIVILGISIFLIFWLKSVVASLFLSYVLYAALNETVEKVNKFKFGNKSLTRNQSMSLVAIGFILAITFLIWGVIAPTYEQITEFLQNLDNSLNAILEKEVFSAFFDGANLDQVKSQISDGIERQSQRFFDNPDLIVNFSRNLFGGFFILITVVSITFYQLTEPGKLKSLAISLANPNSRKKVEKLVNEVEFKLGNWMQGQLILMLMVGILSYIGLRVLQIPFALSLAIIFGLLDIIPILGPVIAFIPLAIITLGLGEPWQFIGAGLFFIFVQQVEGNFLVPKVMQQSVGLDPVLVITALVIGSQLLGVLGAILSIPAAVIIVVLYNQWTEDRKEADKKKVSKLE